METALLNLPFSISKERVSYLINSKGIDPIISNIDLEMVKLKLQDQEDGYGWSSDYCDEAEISYKRFLHLNKKYPDFSIVPHKTMDTVWHQHILDTRAYHIDTNDVFGKYFHHFPYFGIRSEADRKDLENAFESTKQLFKNEFGEEMINENFEDAAKCQSGCNSSGKCNSR